MKFLNSKSIHLLGLVVGGLSVAFIAITIHNYSSQMGALLLDKKLVGFVLLYSLLYAGILQLVAISWFFLLRSVGDLSIGLLASIEIFSITQIYKYIPSNIFHFVGRFAVASRRGASLSTLSYAQVMEIVLMVLSSAAVALAFTWTFLLQISQQYGLTPIVGLFVFGFSSIVTVIGSPIISSMYFFKTARAYTLFGSVLSVLLYILFFIANGSIVAGITEHIYDVSVGYKSILGVTAASWLVGFVVPGAPGGLGVREAVLIAGLTAIGVPVPTATVVALLHRLVTVLGDVVLFGLGIALRRISAG
ncbi:hypothetical protein L614_000200003210 [Ochrobactrum sp. J50]|uniref:lysylphosphatidylglycerol synthase domain-containing protein n=1 Tax=Ochrobactrum sp. J50 TaxID=936132 RepID=UPI0011A47ED0|nr:lysylphosphatidylglycerol synthase domain-containing protein [Ochrobactrum sp. J50]TWH02337.1 hypothetical protein L614_000200003210 [Ochrobactrum sp. J50]